MGAFTPGRLKSRSGDASPLRGAFHSLSITETFLRLRTGRNSIKPPLLFSQPNVTPRSWPVTPLLTNSGLAPTGPPKWPTFSPPPTLVREHRLRGYERHG